MSAVSRPLREFEVEVLVREVYLDSAIHEFAQVRPVLEVPDAPVDLVDDHACGAAGLKLGKHAVEVGAS